MKRIGFSSTHSFNPNVSARNMINKTKYLQILRNGENVKFHSSYEIFTQLSYKPTSQSAVGWFIRRSSKKCGIVNVIIFNLHSTANDLYFCSFNSLNTFKFVRSLVVRSSCEFLARLQPVFKATNKQLVARSLPVKTYRNFKRRWLCAPKTNYIIAKFIR